MPSSETRHTRDASELERSLGLPSALSIGVGTMVGAGIFIFPGLAAGAAGPAAALSFALGAVVALLVALPASELATAMPHSGGAYHFVSRGLGDAWGAVVGIGQWTGLVFAAAFYLVGAGHYVAEVAATTGIAGDLPAPWIGFGVALVLALVSLVGTRGSGLLQNATVLLLLVILSTFLGWAGLQALGLVDGAVALPEAVAPFGVLPVFTTAATVFTSYLGFVQIAAVAGEIEDPGRTIPRAMLGSVVVVGVLYVATLLMATAVLDPSRLGELGETAMVEVASTLAGPLGAAAFLLAGVLATVSSANASILSSSRSVFALGRDGVVPEAAGAVNERFRTPHVAILMAAVPMAALTLFGGLDLLAEVASLLHLVLYGLLCFALVALRRRRPEGYEPVFRCPGYPWVPVTGGLASFGLIALMQPLSQLVGAGILALAWLWQHLHDPEPNAEESLA